MPLPAAPNSLSDAGLPRFGTYAGRVTDSSLAGLTAPFAHAGARRLAREKKWHYACAASKELVIGGAVIQLGYLASCFVYVFDRQARKLLVDRSMVIPPMLAEVSDSPAHARAVLRSLRTRVEIEASVSGGRFSARFPGDVEIDLQLRGDGAPVPLTAICPVPGEGVTLTQKTCCLTAEGLVRVGSEKRKLSEAFASLDYTHGLLARETAWRWASASGRGVGGEQVGLNLVAGQNDGEATENGIWIDGALSRLSKVQFDFDPQRPTEPWKIESEDARVKLRFVPEGKRAENIDLKLIASQYVQPIGTFEGTLRGEDGREVRVSGLPGVTENHRAVW